MASAATPTSPSRARATFPLPADADAAAAAAARPPTSLNRRAGNSFTPQHRRVASNGGGSGKGSGWLFYVSVLLLAVASLLVVVYTFRLVNGRYYDPEPPSRVHAHMAAPDAETNQAGGGGGMASNNNKPAPGAGGHGGGGSGGLLSLGATGSNAKSKGNAQFAPAVPHHYAASPAVEQGFLSVIVPVRTATFPTTHLRRAAVTRLPHVEFILVATDMLTDLAFNTGVAELETAAEAAKKVGDGSTFGVFHAAATRPKLVRVTKNKETELYPTYAEFLMFGADAADPRASHVVFLAQTHSPRDPLFLDALWDSFRQTQHNSAKSEPPAYMQCTGLTPTEREDQRRTANFVTIDRGYEVLLGSAHAQPAVFMARRMTGFSERDARLGGVHRVDAASLFCALVDRQRLYAVGGTIAYGYSGVDMAMAGKLTGRAVGDALEVLRARILRVEKTMESISLAEVHNAGNSLRQQVREAYAEVVDTSALWEELSGKVFDSEITRKLPRHIQAEDDANVRSVAREPIEMRLKFHTRKLVDEAQRARKLSRSRDSSIVEEQTGWDLALKLRTAGFSTWVSNVSAVVDFSVMPKDVQEAMGSATVAHVSGSYPLVGDFHARWGTYARALHKAFASPSQPLTRVVWFAICCGCCGFSSEILHFVYPLQRLQYVSTLLGAKCFCGGYPTAISDTIQRVHITGDQFVLQRTSHNEIVVWISHTDPSSYANDIHNRRRPDYLVGRSMYEFSRIGSNWVDATQIVHEIWVPATWVRDMFVASGVDSSKLHIIPEGVDTDFYDPTAHAKIPLPLEEPYESRWIHYCNKPAPQNAYKFFSNFKWEPRKGWDILFEAYELQFGHSARAKAWRAESTPIPPVARTDGSDPAASDSHHGTASERPVSLYVLSYLFLFGNGNIHNVSHVVYELRAAMAERFDGLTLEEMPHFCIITDTVSEEDLAQLNNAADAFVLPTRGEGWGLPAIQAMSLAKPVISTNWGGQMEFMTPETSFLIELDGVDEVPESTVYGWQPGKKWATPSLTHLGQLMRYVVANPRHAQAVGQRARKHIVRHFSEDVVARIVDARLQEITAIVLKRREANNANGAE